MPKSEMAKLKDEVKSEMEKEFDNIIDEVRSCDWSWLPSDLVYKTFSRPVLENLSPLLEPNYTLQQDTGKFSEIKIAMTFSALKRVGKGGNDYQVHPAGSS